MFEASAEFLPELNIAAESREPAYGGQVVGALLCFVSWGVPRNEGAGRGRVPGILTADRFRPVEQPALYKLA